MSVGSLGGIGPHSMFWIVPVAIDDVGDYVWITSSFNKTVMYQRPVGPSGRSSVPLGKISSLSLVEKQALGELTPLWGLTRLDSGLVRAQCGFWIRGATLQAQNEYPPSMQCKDKFLLRSTIVPVHTDVDELAPDTFNKEGGRLKVFYMLPNATSGDEGLRSSTQGPDSNSALQRLKDEGDAAVKQTVQLQQEVVGGFVIVIDSR